MSGLLLHCRAGFEAECAAEAADRAAAHGVIGSCRTTVGSARVELQTATPTEAARLLKNLPLRELAFTRQWFVILDWLPDLPRRDRVSALALAATALPHPVAEVCLEAPDTNPGKALWPLARALRRPLEDALAARGLLRDEGAGWRLHVCLEAGDAAWVGYGHRDNSSPWPMGIPRLRLSAGAPSRSSLKLEEAFLHFLSPAERENWLAPGRRAVDLGAAPGGWTWQLVRRHLQVTAVDNGSLARSLLDSGLVRHLRVDGFRYRPERPVDWMVCDMVEQPARVAELASRWVAEGWCRHSVFNLKLPMKRRYPEVSRCVDRVRARMEDAGMRHELACKQLYHDREEVSVYLGRR